VRSVLACILLMSASCGGQQLQVQHFVSPDYPTQAHTANIQGTVKVEVMIGGDGKVFWAKGTGGHPLLVEEAEKNIRLWTFGPFPSVAEFPIRHSVTYSFKLQGEPVIGLLLPTIKTHLPDSVEIVSCPSRPGLVSEPPPPASPGKKK